MGQEEVKRAQVDRSKLLLVLDRLDLGFSPDEKRDYWAMHDLLTKLARAYDPARDLARVYITKRELHLLEQEQHASRFARIWVAAGQSGKDSLYRLNRDFAASVSRRWAIEMQRRAAHQAKQERRAQGRSTAKSSAAIASRVVR